MDVFALFAVMVERPLLALIPAAVFGLAAWFSRSRLAWAAAAVWGLYALYEFGNQARLLCSGECNIRADLLFIAPALLLLSVAGAVGAAARVMKRRSGQG